MGLDTVELMLSFEDAFRIDIPDNVAATLDTPAKVIDYIHRQQAIGPAETCLAMRQFHRLRTAFVEAGACRRKDFVPNANTDALLPRENRRQIWDLIRARLPKLLPDLRRPPWLVVALTITCLAGGSVLAILNADNAMKGIYSGHTGITPALIMLTSGIALALGFLAARWSRPLATRLPRDCRTPATILHRLLARHPRSFIGDDTPLSREQIAETVKALTIVWCDPRNYREDARFVQDLGLD